jgi:hypothetical protein
MEDMLIYIVYDSWSIFRPFSIFYDHFVYFVVGNWVYFFPFWYLCCTKKSGNPGEEGRDANGLMT